MAPHDGSPLTSAGVVTAVVAVVDHAVEFSNNRRFLRARLRARFGRCRYLGSLQKTAKPAILGTKLSMASLTLQDLSSYQSRPTYLTCSTRGKVEALVYLT
jgi:hypothetical protein